MKSFRLLSLVLAASFVLVQGSAMGQGAQIASQGFRYLENQQYGKARAFFQNLAAQPTAEAQYYTGAFYMEMGKPDSARIYFDKGLAADPKSALNMVGQGELALFAKNPAQAKTFFDQAIKASKSKNAEVFYRIGRAYMRPEARDMKQAINALEKAKDLDNKNAQYYVTLGDAYLEINDASKAALNYERANYFNPNQPQANLRAGNLFVLARNYNEALRKFNEAAAIDSTYAPTYKSLGEIYFMAKQYDKAAQNYGRYLQLAEADADARYVYAGYLYLSKDYPAAIRELTALDAANYPNPVLHRLLGYSYFESKQDPAAGLQQMKQFMAEAKPEDVLPSDYENFARLELAAGGDTTNALSNLRRTAQLDSARTDVLLREIASTYLKGRKYAEAAGAYEDMSRAGIKLGATDLLNLGKVYYSSQNFQKADSVFALVTELASRTNTTWLWRARASAKLDPESTEGRARPYYEKYIEVTNNREMTEDPTKFKRELIEANFYLGYYFFNQQDYANAQKYLTEVLALDPEHANAKTLMADIAKK